jgi:ornithine cyclodeaminase
MQIIELDQIKKALGSIDLLPSIEAGFIAYSEGGAVIPPVGELLFENPPGDVHIKYGYLSGDDYYVIKIASGFYENHKRGLPSGNGLMLLFNQGTGQLVSILLDGGYLTDLRTAAAGAVVARAMAPRQIKCIGIIGTGVQAKLQLKLVADVTTCRRVIVMGRTAENLSGYKKEMEEEGFRIEVTKNPEEVASGCNLIITTTPATSPILHAGQIQSGTHITAVGSDTSEKQELHADVLKKADIVVADSIGQCKERGEIYQALQHKAIAEDSLIELGNVLSGKVTGRESDDQITIADLTGVAVQDIQIAKAVYEQCRADTG